MDKDVEFDCSQCGEHLIFKDFESIPVRCPKCGMQRSHTMGGTKPHKIIKGKMWISCREKTCRARLRVSDIYTQNVNKDGADWQSYWKGGKRFDRRNRTRAKNLA